MQYVNISKTEPFGYLVSEPFGSIAAAKAARMDHQRTVSRAEAAEILLEDAASGERRSAALAHVAKIQQVLDENVMLKMATVGRTEPAHAMADVPEKIWTMLSSLRLALAGSGHVRPRILDDGRISTEEVEAVFTEHDVAVLLQKLSVAGETVGP